MATTHPVSPSWFRIAVKALVVIACSEDACPSATIAQDVDAHAVFLRRVLAQLVRVQVVEAREGRGGGYRLARTPEEITLAEVFRAVRLVETPDETVPDSCMSARVATMLNEIAVEAEEHIIASLERYTIADVLQRAIREEAHAFEAA